MNDKPHLVIVGAGDVADALVRLSATLGWHPSVVSDADTARAVLHGVGGDDPVVVLSHDEAVEGPALAAALDGAAGYVGAMGGRATRERRARWLVEHGTAEAALERLHTPAGLDLGAESADEIAVAIVAEILAVRNGRSGGSLKGSSAPLHPERGPGDAGCPA